MPLLCVPLCTMSGAVSFSAWCARCSPLINCSVASEIKLAVITSSPLLPGTGLLSSLGLSSFNLSPSPPSPCAKDYVAINYPCNSISIAALIFGACYLGRRVRLILASCPKHNRLNSFASGVALFLFLLKPLRHFDSLSAILMYGYRLSHSLTWIFNRYKWGEELFRTNLSASSLALRSASSFSCFWRASSSLFLLSSSSRRLASSIASCSRCSSASRASLAKRRVSSSRRRCSSSSARNLSASKRASSSYENYCT